jgi:hypothetical protein
MEECKIRPLHPTQSGKALIHYNNFVSEVPSSRSPVFRPDMSGARFVFFDQTATSLRLGFETPDARHAFVKILAHFWQEDFGVELEIVG